MDFSEIEVVMLKPRRLTPDGADVPEDFELPTVNWDGKEFEETRIPHEQMGTQPIPDDPARPGEPVRTY